MPVILINETKILGRIPIGKFCTWKTNHEKRNVDLQNNPMNNSATTPSKKIVDVSNERKYILIKGETFRNLIQSKAIDDPNNCFLVAQFFCLPKANSFGAVGIFLCLKKKQAPNDIIISDIYLGHDVIGGIDSRVSSSDFIKTVSNYSDRKRELTKITSDFNADREGVAHSIKEVRNWFNLIPDEIAIYFVTDNNRRRTVVFADAMLPEDFCSTSGSIINPDLFDQGSTCCPI